MIRTLPVRRSLVACAAALSLVAAPLAFAQLPSPQLTSVYPVGAKQGASIDLTISGANFDGPVKLVFSHPGLSAPAKMTEPTEFEPNPKPVANTFKLTVAPETPPGLYEVRFVGRYGQSNPRTIVVSAMDEAVKAGGNNTPDKAADLPVGSAVSARVDANAYDCWRLSLKKNDRVLIDCMAERIDSRMNASMLLLDPSGKEITRALDTIGRDPVIDFIAPADGSYVLKVYDFTFNGGPEHFYRLSAAAAPLVDFVFPPAGAPGSNDAYTVYGRNLPGGQPADGLTIGGAVLEKLTVNIPLPGDPTAADPNAVVATSPRAAMVDGIQWRLTTAQGAANPVKIGFAQAPVVREAEPNDTSDNATALTLPADVAGQFFPQRDQDWYVFDAKQGETWFLDVISNRLDRASDPALLVQRIDKDAQGVEKATDVADVDDAPDRAQRIGTDFDTTSDDPSFKLVVPTDGKYRVRVKDNFGDTRRDPRFVYRLVIRKPTPDFRLAVFPEIPVAPPNPNLSNLDGLSLRRGGSALLRVAVVRLDEFEGEIQVQAEGLPEGVTCAGATIDKKVATASLVLQATEGAAPFAGPIRVVAKAKINGADVARPARTGSVLWGTANRQADPAKFRTSRDLQLTVADKELEPATIQIGDGAVVQTSLGAKVTLPVKIARRAEWKTPLKLSRAGLPDQIIPKEMNLDPNTNEGTFELELYRQDIQPGSYTFYMRGDGNISFERDPQTTAALEEEQKVFTEKLAKFNEAKTAATTARDQANAAAQAAKTALQTAEQAKNTADAAAKQAAQTADTATKAAAQAKEAAAKDPNNADLANAATNAQKAADDAAVKKKEADEKFVAAEKAFKEATDKNKEAEEKRVAGEKELEAATAKANQATTFKQQLDQRVAQTKQANAKKDIPVGLVSTPIKIQILPSPLTVNVAANVGPVKAGEKLEVPVQFERKFGYAQPVEIFLEPPPGVAGLAQVKVDVPADKNDGVVMLTPQKNTPPGDHKFVVRVRGRWNNVQCDTLGETIVKIEAPAP